MGMNGGAPDSRRDGDAMKPQGGIWVIAALGMALTLAGCTSATPHSQIAAGPMPAATEPSPSAEAPIRPVQEPIQSPHVEIRSAEEPPPVQLRTDGPMEELLATPAAPNCAFKAKGAGSADPEVLAKLRLDFERQCYKKAEAAARRRLKSLQAVVRLMVL